MDALDTMETKEWNCKKRKPLVGGAFAELKKESSSLLALVRNVFREDGAGRNRRTLSSRCCRLGGRCASPVDIASQACSEHSLIDVGAQLDLIRAVQHRYA